MNRCVLLAVCFASVAQAADELVVEGSRPYVVAASKPAPRKAPVWPSYPSRSYSGRVWTYNGGQITAAHLADPLGHHRGKFNADWLNTLSDAQLTALGTDAHEGNVRWQFAVRPDPLPESVPVSPPPTPADPFLQQFTAPVPLGPPANPAPEGPQKSILPQQPQYEWFQANPQHKGTLRSFHYEKRCNGRSCVWTKVYD